MNNITETINEFKNMDYIDFDIEKLYSKTDQKRYNNYLIKYVFKYYNDIKKLNNYYLEKNLNNDNTFAGIFRNNHEISCIIPKRQTLYDEIVCIHELTHLISQLNKNIDNNSIYNEVIPYFNEYNYLKSIHNFYAKQYQIFRLNTAIKAAKNLDKHTIYKTYSYIFAYLILEKRKNNYDIKKLNKINSNSKDIEKKLILKGYTI